MASNYTLIGTLLNNSMRTHIYSRLCHFSRRNKLSRLHRCIWPSRFNWCSKPARSTCSAGSAFATFPAASYLQKANLRIHPQKQAASLQFPFEKVLFRDKLAVVRAATRFSGPTSSKRVASVLLQLQQQTMKPQQRKSEMHAQRCQRLLRIGVIP